MNSLSKEIESILDGMEPVAKARFLRGATSIGEVAQVSMAVSMRRIADALSELGTPTMVVSSKTSFREMSPEQIIETMRHAGRTHPDGGQL